MKATHSIQRVGVTIAVTLTFTPEELNAACAVLGGLDFASKRKAIENSIRRADLGVADRATYEIFKALANAWDDVVPRQAWPFPLAPHRGPSTVGAIEELPLGKMRFL